jgi:hypothetical protein
MAPSPGARVGEATAVAVATTDAAIL